MEVVLDRRRDARLRWAEERIGDGAGDGSPPAWGEPSGRPPRMDPPGRRPRDRRCRPRRPRAGHAARDPRIRRSWARPLVGRAQCPSRSRQDRTRELGEGLRKRIDQVRQGPLVLVGQLAVGHEAVLEVSVDGQRLLERRVPGVDLLDERGTLSALRVGEVADEREGQLGPLDVGREVPQVRAGPPVLLARDLAGGDLVEQRDRPVAQPVDALVVEVRRERRRNGRSRTARSRRRRACRRAPLAPPASTAPSPARRPSRRPSSAIRGRAPRGPSRCDGSRSSRALRRRRRPRGSRSGGRGRRAPRPRARSARSGCGRPGTGPWPPSSSPAVYRLDEPWVAGTSWATCSLTKAAYRSIASCLSSASGPADRDAIAGHGEGAEPTPIPTIPGLHRVR